MTKWLLLATGVVVLGGCASGPTRHEVRLACRMEMDAARTAVQLREQGKDKMSMLRTLPPLQKHSTRLLNAMYQVVDETYACPALNDIVYGIYRYEVCARQLRHQPVPATISSVYPQLQACQAQFHRQVTKQSVDCIRQVFPADQKQVSDKSDAG